MGKKKGTGTPTPPRLGYDPELIWPLYERYDGNASKLVREERGNPDIPKNLKTVLEYEKKFGWVARLEALRNEAGRRTDALIIRRQVGLASELIDEFEEKLRIQLGRLPGSGQGADGFADDSQATLLRSIAAALKDLQLFRGGPTERHEDTSNAVSLEDLEAASKHPDGVVVGLRELRRRRYGKRVPGGLG